MEILTMLAFMILGPASCFAVWVMFEGIDAKKPWAYFMAGALTFLLLSYILSR